MNATFAHDFDTPLGQATALVDERGRALALELGNRPGIDTRHGPLERGGRAGELAARVERQVGEYFAGTRRVFELELAPRGTAFQQAVWRELADIPFGEITSYGALATKLGKPTASRAVGAANGQNPLWLVLPCHRVVGADGKLTGYAGGLAVKRALLEHEGHVVEESRIVPLQESTLF